MTQRVLLSQFRRFQLTACLMLLFLLGLSPFEPSVCLFVVNLGFNLGLVLEGPSASFWCSPAMTVSRCAACFLDAASRFTKISILAGNAACVHSSTCSESTLSNWMISLASFADGLQLFSESINADLVVFCNTSFNSSN